LKTSSPWDKEENTEMVMAGQIKQHVHRMSISDSGKFGMCQCGRHLQYDLEKPRNPPIVLREGDPNYVDPEPVSKPGEKVNQNVDGNPTSDAKVKRHKGGTAMKERHKYIEDHKAEILKDMAELGTSAALKKWDISSSGWFTIRKRWGISNKIVKVPTENRKPVADITIIPTDEIYAILDRIQNRLDKLTSGLGCFVIEWSNLMELTDNQFKELMLLLRNIQKARETNDGQRSL
jgi:hypothetical protein